MKQQDTVTPRELKALRAFDTPTICNALELVVPERRQYGYTTEPLQCIYPDLPPIVGYARTGTIRATEPSGRGAKEEREARLAWYRYVDEGLKPAVVVLQDLDGARAGYGAFWGEVNSHIHRGLGCLGVVTNGSVRDIPANAARFQMIAASVRPSHASVHVVSVGGAVTVSGMAVNSRDIIHADRHGAVVVPLRAVRQIARAVELIAKREAVIIRAAKSPRFDWHKLQEAMQDAADIH